MRHLPTISLVLISLLVSMPLRPQQTEPAPPPDVLPVPIDPTQIRYAVVDGDTLLHRPDLVEVRGFQSDGAGGFLAVARNSEGALGYLDHRGRWVVPPTLDDARAFSDDGLARFRRDGLWGYLDRTGKVVIEPRFAAALPFEQGLAPVLIPGGRDESWAYVDVDGNVAIEGPFRRADPFSPAGLAVVSPRGRELFGFIDRSGKLVVPARFQAVWPFHPTAGGGGVAPAVVDDFVYVLIDHRGKRLTVTDYDGIQPFNEEGLAFFTRDGGYQGGVLDATGHEVLVDRDAYGPIACGLVRNGRGSEAVGFLDAGSGERAFAERFRWAGSFSSDCALREGHGVTLALGAEGWGVLDSGGTMKRLVDPGSSPSPYREPLTDLEGTILGFDQRSGEGARLVPMLADDGSVDYLDRDGRVVYSAAVSAETGLLTLSTAEGVELWRSAATTSPPPARLMQDHREHFLDQRFWEGDITTVAEVLLRQTPRDFVPLDGYSAHDDPYQPDPDDPDLFDEYASRGAIEHLATSSVDEGLWGAYYFLASERSAAFSRYFDTLSVRLDRAYERAGEDAPVRALLPGDTNEQRVWRAGNRFLVLEHSGGYGDGDFWNNLWLAAIEANARD